MHTDGKRPLSEPGDSHVFSGSDSVISRADTGLSLNSAAGPKVYSMTGGTDYNGICKENGEIRHRDIFCAGRTKRVRD